MSDPSPELRAFFEHHLRQPPTIAARAPGRVNLIGEHTDYNLLPVFPMAIQYGITILARPRSDNRVSALNLDPAFEPVAFGIGREIPKSSAGHWGNYLKAAAQAVATIYGGKRGMDAVVAGDLPVAAGLSSSSALVVATGLALLEANRVTADRYRLMDEFARAEAYVGTQGGGMDQAIALAGKAGMACRIDFAPLRLEHIVVPVGWRFVIASSLTSAEKSGTAQATYNRRTEECRQALQRVAKAFGLSEATYPSLMKAHPLGDLLDRAPAVLTPSLLARFRHVVTETDRVAQAVEAMKRADSDAFGRVMLASHLSLRDDYQVSTPELDRLVAIAIEAGALGARLTGAGLGGATVALMKETRVEAVLAGLDQEFYRPRLDRVSSEHVRFVARPSGGATVGRLSR